MTDIYLYNKDGDYLCKYKTNIVPRIGEVLFYEDEWHTISTVEHIIIDSELKRVEVGTKS